MSAPECHIDLETRSRCSLKTAGTARYAEDSSTEVLCFAYAIGDGDVKLWSKGEPFPREVREHAEAGGAFVAHNAAFDSTILAEMHRRDPATWPDIKPEQWRCTMIRARALALPGSLEQGGAILGLATQKDKAGHRLMMKLCKPNKKGVFPGTPEEFAALGAYCRTDVATERGFHHALPPLPEREQELYALDMVINRRGVPIDVDGVQRVAALTETVGRRLSLKVSEITGGRVGSVSEVAAMLDFLEGEGVALEKLSKDHVARALKGAIDSDVARQVLQIRKLAAKASTAKLKKMLACVMADGRIRGVHAFLGADTWRWAGRMIQTQNLPRPEEGFDWRHVIEWTKEPNGAELLEDWYGSALDPISWSLRSLIKAPKGRKFIACDYSNIEGRVLAWCAGEEWKLQAFREYDAGKGPDLYKLAYSKSFGVPVDQIAYDQRQIGKVQELALGYQGGLGAFTSMAANYGITVIGDDGPRPDDAGQVLTESQVDSIKQGWRDAHPKVVDFWYALERAAINATERHGKIFEVGPVAFRRSGDFLFCRLPSGRKLAYPFPHIEKFVNRWGREQSKIQTYGIDSKRNRKWGIRYPYGGLFCENIVQAIARDILAEAMPRLEREQYEIVMHVHDEAVCEVPAGFGSWKEMAEIMCELPAWAHGMPITAGGWQGERYRK